MVSLLGVLLLNVFFGVGMLVASFVEKPRKINLIGLAIVISNVSAALFYNQLGH